jgi:hypothetical protein
MSVDLAKDIAYIPKVQSGLASGSESNIGYVAITREKLFFVPCKKQDETEEMTRILEIDESFEFWKIIPELAQQLEPEMLAKVIEQMAENIEGSQAYHLNDIKEFRFGLTGVEAVLSNDAAFNFNMGTAPKKKKRLRGFLKQRGLLHE